MPTLQINESSVNDVIQFLFGVLAIIGFVVALGAPESHYANLGFAVLVLSAAGIIGVGYNR